MGSPKTIVVGTDFSALADIAVDTAFVLARRLAASRVHVVHVLDRSATVAYAYPDSQVMEGHRQERAEARLEKIGAKDIVVTREVRRGIPSRDLAEAAREARGDLIVIASHGYGTMRRTLLGSVAASLIRTSHVPVLIVGADRRGLDFENVLAAVDLSPISGKVAALAREYGRGQVKIVSAFEPPLIVADEVLPAYATRDDVQLAREERLQQLSALAPGVEVELLERDPPSTAILEAAREEGADLLVIGTSGHSAWHRMFIGSTATRVLADAPCPVLVVPAETEER